MCLPGSVGDGGWGTRDEALLGSCVTWDEELGLVPAFRPAIPYTWSVGLALAFGSDRVLSS